MFLQLAIAAVAMAAPTMHVEKADAWQYGTGGGIVGFIVLILDIIVIGEFSSSRPPPVTRSVGKS